MKNTIKRFVPINAVQKIRSVFQEIDVLLIRFFSQSGWLASCYYLFISGQFKREQRAVLLGRLAYHDANTAGLGTVMLRRNIHRLEKGIIMRPRRAVFASLYIEETVACYRECIKNNSLSLDERTWANDVLDKYFEIAGEEKSINKARAEYDEVLASYREQTVSSNQSIPYSHDKTRFNAVNYDDLYSLFRQRRSVRWYLDKKVDISLVKKAVNAASLAPSACNRQPFKFIVVNDKTKIESVAGCAMGTAGFVHNLPSIIAIVGDLSSYPEERDRHVIYIDASLASMQLMLALETLGLSSCPINWPDIESREKSLQAKLNLKYHERTIMLLAVGYADPSGLIPFSQKKSDAVLLEEIK